MSSTASDEKVQGMILTTATLLANSPTLKLKEAMMMTGYTQKDIKDIANQFNIQRKHIELLKERHTRYEPVPGPQDRTNTRKVNDKQDAHDEPPQVEWLQRKVDPAVANRIFQLEMELQRIAYF